MPSSKSGDSRRLVKFQMMFVLGLVLGLFFGYLGYSEFGLTPTMLLLVGLVDSFFFAIIVGLMYRDVHLSLVGGFGVLVGFVLVWGCSLAGLYFFPILVLAFVLGTAKVWKINGSITS